MSRATESYQNIMLEIREWYNDARLYGYGPVYVTYRVRRTLFDGYTYPGFGSAVTGAIYVDFYPRKHVTIKISNKYEYTRIPLQDRALL